MRVLGKVASGIKGLDEITSGGLPAGRPTLVCGGPGSGKTLLAIAFLAEGALHGGEAGVLLSFDERISDLDTNTASLNLDLADLRDRKMLAIDHVHIEPRDIIETGDFDLEGLFVRLAHAVQSVDAKRVVLDGIDNLFAGIENTAILRAELRRLFGWLKDRNLSTVVTAERGERSLSRNGIEEYISDCVILLDHRIDTEVATRRLRIVKYRGSAHGGNEYPFLIDSGGIELFPITSMGFGQSVSNERLSTGIVGLDEMFEGRGYYKGSSVFLSGAPGTGKTSFAAHFAVAAAARGDRCLYFAFEEAEAQLVRNMATIGLDLGTHIQRKKLMVHARRPTLQGLEQHLASMMQAIRANAPDVVVLDPLSALQIGDTVKQSSMMVLRLMDHLKELGITALYLAVQEEETQTDLNISSMMDTWITVKNARSAAGLERNIAIVKSRGMGHSADIRRFLIGKDGVKISARGSEA